MKTRLRYKEVNGLLTLYKPLLAGNDILQVSVDPKNFEAIIISINTGMPVSAIKSTSLTTLKKLIKNQLKALHVSFKDEVRPGRNLKFTREDYENELLKELEKDQ